MVGTVATGLVAAAQRDREKKQDTQPDQAKHATRPRAR